MTSQVNTASNGGLTRTYTDTLKPPNQLNDEIPASAPKSVERPIDWFQLSFILTGLICMGAGLGFERSLLPRMAVTTFHHTSVSTVLNFVASFGLSKAIANIFAGPIADKFGRKITLIAGFIVGLPVMPFIIVAESWEGICVMNVMFGFSQGLLGSALFFLLIDVLGPSRRGIAVGVGECSIYVSTAILNVIAGDLASRFGFRPVPFYVATGFAVFGLISTIPLQDTMALVQAEQSEHESRRSGRSTQGAELVPCDTSSSVPGGGSSDKVKEPPIHQKEKEGRLRQYVEQDSGFSSESDDDIAARPTYQFAATSTGKNEDEPKWTVDQSEPVLYEDSEEEEEPDAIDTTASLSTAGISLPLVNDVLRKGPLSQSKKKTTMEEYKEFESRMENQLERGAPEDLIKSIRLEEKCVGALSENALLASLRFHSSKTNVGERKALLSLRMDSSDSSFGGDKEGQYRYDAFDKSEKGPEEASAFKVLYALLFENKNFAVLCYCGMIMNFKDGFAWGSFPVFFSDFHNLSDDNTDLLIAIYPLCWGFAQAFTGALSDLYGRKMFLIVGIGSCTLAVALFAVPGVLWGRPANNNELHVMVWAAADVFLGLGTACAYPALQAGAADEIDPVNRGIGLGFYRFIRDCGYVVGALVCGRITDAVGGETGYMVTFLLVSFVMSSSLLLVIFVYKPEHWSISQWKVT